MPLTLTEDMQRELDARNGDTRLVDPRTNAEYVLVTAAEYESVREQLEEERFMRAWSRASVAAVGKRLAEDERDPAG